MLSTCSMVSSGEDTVCPMVRGCVKSSKSPPPSWVLSPKKWTVSNSSFGTNCKQNVLSHPVGQTSMPIWPPMLKVRLYSVPGPNLRTSCSSSRRLRPAPLSAVSKLARSSFVRAGVLPIGQMLTVHWRNSRNVPRWSMDAPGWISWRRRSDSRRSASRTPLRPASNACQRASPSFSAMLLQCSCSVPRKAWTPFSLKQKSSRSRRSGPPSCICCLLKSPAPTMPTAYLLRRRARRRSIASFAGWAGTASVPSTSKRMSVPPWGRACGAGADFEKSIAQT
mmetsp:Transcript_78695/g.222598  ORF Transcript_78695/g.222598 Transcript_78695/m.222598 type:complete len:279 (-) Transcript_78695:47-883(-)